MNQNGSKKEKFLKAGRYRGGGQPDYFFFLWLKKILGLLKFCSKQKERQTLTEVGLFFVPFFLS